MKSSIPLVVVAIAAIAVGCMEKNDASPKDIFKIVEDGDADNLNKLLADGTDPDVYRDAAGQTPLFKAAWKGHVEIARTLIARGADVNATDRRGETPLHQATWDGCELVLRLLVKSGATIDARDEKRWTPLHWAAWQGQAQIVRELIAQGASVLTLASHGETPLHSAAGTQHAGVVWVLTRNGAIPNAQTTEGYTPLHSALRGGDEEKALAVIRLIIEAGGDVEAADDQGETPFSLAERRGWKRVANDMRKALDAEQDRVRKTSDCYFVLKGSCIDSFPNGNLLVLATTTSPRSGTCHLEEEDSGDAAWEQLLGRLGLRNDCRGQRGVKTETEIFESKIEASEDYEGSCTEVPLPVSCLRLGRILLH